MTYRFDPELAPFVGEMPAVDLSDPARVRAASAARLGEALPYESPVPLAVEDRRVPGADGDPDVPVRVYAPASRNGVLPGLLYIHGGGFCIGSVDGDDARAREVAAIADAVVVSVEYQLAPEHPFPAGLRDCFAALGYLAKNAAELGIDPRHIGVAGNSAGAGLAAATALMARDQGGPELCLQYLNIPELDDRLETPSVRAFTDTPVANRANLILTWQHYLAGQPATAYAAPARAADLAGLPPSYVAVCEFDPLRDEGIGYAQRLVQAGVPVELHLYPGTFHGSSRIAGAAVSRRMSRDSLEAIRRLLRA
jgi:acetyl esterase/lipase